MSGEVTVLLKLDLGNVRNNAALNGTAGAQIQRPRGAASLGPKMAQPAKDG